MQSHLEMLGFIAQSKARLAAAAAPVDMVNNVDGSSLHIAAQIKALAGREPDRVLTVLSALTTLAAEVEAEPWPVEWLTGDLVAAANARYGTLLLWRVTTTIIERAQILAAASLNEAALLDTGMACFWAAMALGQMESYGASLPLAGSRLQA